jgi:hypothetical protein
VTAAAPPRPLAAASSSPAPGAGGPGQAAGHAGSERALLDATERALRAPAGKWALSLNLSCLKAPPPRPYHVRIALALMQDSASRLGGQVFPLRNGDLVLLCGAPETALGTPDASLPGTLLRLFAVDAPGDRLTTMWDLDQAGTAFRDHVAHCLADPATQDEGPPETLSSHGLAALLAWLRAADTRTLLVQRTAVQLRPGRGPKLAGRLVPLFRDIAFDEAALPEAARAGLCRDPFILRHLAGLLHARILAMVTEDVRVRGPLTRPALLQPMELHLALSPRAVLSPGFARLGAQAALRRMRFGVEFSAMEIAGDPWIAASARQFLAHTGFGMVLGGIDHAALVLLRLDAMAPDLVKLDWSPRLADGQAGQVAQAEAAIRAWGPQRVVLCRVDGEAALVWGHGQGITAFQGPYIDAVQAASRITACPAARACSLRACVDRALSVHPAARSGCGCPGLLDVMAVAGTDRVAS